MMNEYNLKLEEARKVEGFKVTYYMELKDIKALFEEGKEFDDIGSLVCMELQNIMIDLNYFDILDYSFVHYAIVNEDEWITSGYSDLDLYEGIFDNKDKFEGLMFDLMMKHIRENNLYWSKANIQLLVH